MLWLLATWLFPSGMLIIPAILLSGEIKILGYNTKYGVCTQKSGHPDVLIYNGINMLTFALPLVIIIASYTAIYVHVRRHSNKFRKIMSLNMSTSTRSEKNDSRPTVDMFTANRKSAVRNRTPMTIVLDNKTTEFRLKRRQIQITKNMLLVVCVFVVCVFPYVVIAQNVKGVAYLVPYVGILVYFNSCVNPLIYCRNPYFKHVYRVILSCRWRDIPEPSGFLKFFIK